jgi:hypothetical protein
MPNDPGFASDTCIFIEANSGDGGVRDPNAIWWLSPDIALTSPAANQSISLDIRVHRKPDTSGCHFPGDENLMVELCVANPSLVMAPIRNSAARVVLTGSPLPLEGATGVQQIDWTPPPGRPDAGGIETLKCAPAPGLRQSPSRSQKGLGRLS